jgi:hypothetical protein
MMQVECIIEVSCLPARWISRAYRVPAFLAGSYAFCPEDFSPVAIGMSETLFHITFFLGCFPGFERIKVGLGNHLVAPMTEPVFLKRHLSPSQWHTS